MAIDTGGTTEDRDWAADERAFAADDRARRGEERQRAADDRGPSNDGRQLEADERERRVGHRERLADERDRLADLRDRAADERDELADRRDRAADEREAALAAWAGLEERARALALEVDDLTTAMEHRAVIEQAKGVIMHTLRCGPDAAFAVLVAQSQDENRKLREVARQIANAQGPPPAP